MFTLLLPVALAAPPLVSAADLAAPGLEVWWREGELLAGVSAEPGRTGMRPLADLAPFALPQDLSAWTRIGARCDRPATTTASLDGLSVVGEVVGTPQEPVVQLRAGARIVAAGALGRPAKACEIRVVQADSLPGLEVVVVWRPLEADSDLWGVAVYHVPEIAR